MRTRILIGSVLLAAVAGLLWLDYRFTERAAASVVILALGLLGFWEFAVLAGVAGREPPGSRALVVWGLAGTAFFHAAAWWGGAEGEGLPADLLALGLAAQLLGSVLLVIFRRDFLALFPSLVASLLGVVLFGLLFSYLLRIYVLGDPEGGLVRGVVLFLGVKGTDIIAFFVGSAIGRYHFLPVSPGKTLEGSLSALAFSGVWFAAASLLWPQHLFGWSEAIAFGIILAVTSQLGDLTESLIKRFYRVKDSGRLLPEFGGVLDLIDSFLFSAFTFWCLLRLA